VSAFLLLDLDHAPGEDLQACRGIAQGSSSRFLRVMSCAKPMTPIGLPLASANRVTRASIQTREPSLR
jgi:hypothetical protein